MELLFQLLLELVSFLSGIGFIFSLYLIGMVGEALIVIFDVAALLGALLRWLFPSLAGGAAREKGGVRVRSKWPLRIALIASFLVAVFLAGVYVANRWYFEPVTRWSLGHLEKRSGIKVDFAEATGSFWTGEFNFRQLTARRSTHDKSRFDISVESIELDVSMTNLLWRKVVFEKLSIREVRGEWDQLARSDKLKARRSFQLNQFTMDDVTLRYTNRTLGQQPLAVTLRIDTLRAPRLGSDWFLWNLLIHSNVTGAVDDTRFEIATNNETGPQFETLWRCDGLPIPLVAQVVGTPLTWFEKGDIDIHVENRYHPRGLGEVTMKWRVALRDFHARAPEGSSLKTRAMAKPLLFFVNRKSEGLDLTFELEWDKDKTRYASSADLGDLARVALGDEILELLKSLAKRGDGEKEE